MRLKLVAGVGLFFVSIGVVLSAVFFGSTPLSGTSFQGGKRDSPQLSTNTDNAIANENSQPGTPNWEIPSDRGASVEIQAYTNATSVLPGDKLTFYVSTLKEGTSYSIAVYRLGWYRGYGGRLMIAVPDQVGHAQGYYDPNKQRLVGCHSCLVDTRTGLVEANWQPSYTLTVPSDWTSGIYLAKFTDALGLQTYAEFDVRDNSHSHYIVVTPDTTYAAYNKWGGYSLYLADSPIEIDKLGRGVKISFDRPYLEAYGTSQVLQLEIYAIRWLERQGYDMSYMSDIDMHSNPALLLQHRAYLSLGHDEYWTKEMRDGVEYARDHGVGLAFLSSNPAYWQIRLEADSAGHPNRTVVCYKVSTENNDLGGDPIFGKDHTRVTTRWRDPLLARPENALVGIMYSGQAINRSGFRWQVNTQATSPLLDGTNLQPGKLYGCGLVGYEWDRVFDNGATPAGLQVLGVSHTIDDNKNPDFSNTTYYVAQSGALVFATGSIYWTAALDDYRLFPNPTCAGQSNVVPEMQKLLANVMAALVVKHPPERLAFLPAVPTPSISGEESHA